MLYLIRHFSARLAIGASVVLLASCGGDGDAPPVAPAPATVSVYAGSLKSAGTRDGNVATAQFEMPRGVAIDATGTIYVADPTAIRKIAPDGTVSTLAGAPGTEGFADGPAASARFANLSDLALDAAGNLYVADTNNHVVRRVTPAGQVSTVAGVPGTAGGVDGGPGTGLLERPGGIALDAAGNIFVTSNNAVRKVTPAGVISTFAGEPGAFGNVFASGRQARFIGLAAVAVDVEGNVYTAETSLTGGAIRKFSASGEAVRFGTDGAPLAVPYPRDLQVDAAGNVYFTSNGVLAQGVNFSVIYRSISRVDASGNLTVVAGGCNAVTTVDGPAATSCFIDPRYLALGANGRVVVTEMSTAAIRSIDNGVVSTLAGGAGEGLVDGDRLAARFNFLTGIAAGPDGSLYVADSPNRLIRRIDPAGVVTRITTGGVFPGNVAVSDGGSVLFTGPNSIVGRFVYQLRAGAPVIVATATGDSTAMALDAAGNLYLSDNGQVTVTAPDGAKRTLASGVFALALAVDRAGLVHFIAAGAIGTIDAQGRVTTRATTGGRDLALDGSGNVYFADGRLVRKLAADGVVTTVVDLSSLEGVGNAQITGVAIVGSALYATVRNAVVRVAPLN